MRVCVIGGSGNISTSIVRVLLNLGHEVTCFIRGQSRTIPDGARLLQGDRMDRAAFEKKIQAEHFKAAIDLICFNREDAESSVRAFRGVQHFIQCSTVCTYGIELDWMPVTEDHPLRPITDYGRNKVAADLVTGFERALQIDAAADQPAAECRLGHCLVGDVHGKESSGAAPSAVRRRPPAGRAKRLRASSASSSAQER